MDLCVICRSPLPPQGQGQRRFYCSRACQAKAYRKRRQRLDEDLIPSVTKKDPLDQLVEIILSVRWVTARLRRLEGDIAPALGLRCITVADDLDKTMATNFPEACGRAQTASDRAMRRLKSLVAEHPLPGDEG